MVDTSIEFGDQHGEVGDHVGVGETVLGVRALAAAHEHGQEGAHSRHSHHLKTSELSICKEYTPAPTEIYRMIVQTPGPCSKLYPV